MSSLNVELVQSIYAEWERGDFRSTWWADPEIEWVLVDGPAPGTWTGWAGMAEAMRDFLSAWEDFRGEVEGFRELDGDRVLVLVHYSGRGKLSGLELGALGARGAQVIHIRAGKVIRLVRYLDRDRALTDLGLAPEAGSPRS